MTDGRSVSGGSIPSNPSSGERPLLVAIPVHDGQDCLAATLQALARQGDLETLTILVLCNGCRDRSAEIARQAGCLFERCAGYEVLELPAIGRCGALKIALGRCRDDRIGLAVLDQDAVLSPGAFAAVRAAFESGRHFATLRPRPRRSNSRLVRAYYRFWLALDYVQRSPATIGFYAVSAQGLANVTDLPSVHSDDKYLRLRISPAERFRIESEWYRVEPQRSFVALVRDRARYNRGNRELACLSPRQNSNDLPRHAVADLHAALRRPGDGLAFIATILLSRLYAVLSRP